MTNIKMDWTDTGAVVLANVAIGCPVCGAQVQPNIEHRCGDKGLNSSTGIAQDIKRKG